jgi:uncharacterized membrane-anchored protein YjiN (DUF445 family)
VTVNNAERAGPSLAAMRIVAAALLAAMAGLYVLAVLNADAAPAWAYARAFAEAAMVGGLADWFAVTALFRRPLGLPIPHTAIIPRSKARIADALGEFIAVNFLAPRVVAERLAEQDIAGALARQIADPAAAQRIADGIVDALPSIIDLLDDEAVSDFLRRQIHELSRGERLPAAIGRGLKLFTEHGRHQPLVDAALAEGWRAMQEHEDAIRKQVRARTSWLWRIIALDARASDALIGAIETTLQEIAHDPDHPARQRITALLVRLADDLEHAPALRAQIERIVADILSHPQVGAYFAELWRGLKDAARDGAAAEHSETRRALAEAITGFGAALQQDAAAQEAVNRRLRALLTELAGRHGRDLAALISETIRSWDAKTVVEKLEQSVGPDLQYIRINGTLIGGLIGLAIHQATLLLR